MVGLQSGKIRFDPGGLTANPIAVPKLSVSLRKYYTGVAALP
jgi:hypothetical protein